jgi:hypothetical protein
LTKKIIDGWMDTWMESLTAVISRIDGILVAAHVAFFFNNCYLVK